MDHVGRGAVRLELAAMLYGSRVGLRCPSCAHNLIQLFHDNA